MHWNQIHTPCAYYSHASSDAKLHFKDFGESLRERENRMQIGKVTQKHVSPALSRSCNLYAQTERLQVLQQLSHKLEL